MTRSLTPTHIQILTATPYSVRWEDFAAILEQLPSFVREARRIHDVSTEKASSEIGIAPSTLRKFERRRHVVSFDVALDVMHWMAKLADDARRAAAS